MTVRKRRKHARNLERYPLRDDGIGNMLGFDWTLQRRIARRRQHWPGYVGGLWIGRAAGHEYHRRYRARMGR